MKQRNLSRGLGTITFVGGLVMAILVVSAAPAAAGGARVFVGARFGAPVFVHHPFFVHRPFVRTPFVHGHVFVRSRVFIGAPFFVGDPFWWGAWPYYSPPPVVVQPSPTTYVQQAPAAPTYWYYCQSPQGYYPYVTQCPGGWLTVVPPVQPPAQ